MSTRHYKDVSTTMSMFIGGKAGHGILGVGALAGLAGDLSIEAGRLADLSDGVAAEVAMALPALVEKRSDVHREPGLYRNLGRLAGVNCRNLSKQIASLRRRLKNQPRREGPTNGPGRASSPAG